MDGNFGQDVGWGWGAEVERVRSVVWTSTECIVQRSRFGLSLGHSCHKVEPIVCFSNHINFLCIPTSFPTVALSNNDKKMDNTL